MTVSCHSYVYIYVYIPWSKRLPKDSFIQKVQAEATAYRPSTFYNTRPILRGW